MYLLPNPLAISLPHTKIKTLHRPMEGVENSSIDIDSITPEISTAASEADYEAKHIIPLASLTPETATNGALVKVVVVLLFPYSPSTQTLRLVLSEEDFRLRENKGQLRVSFHGAAASKLAGKNVDIGDVLVLSTREARFHKLRNATLRDVPWSLRFDEGLLVKLKVKGAGEWDTLEVNEAHEEKGDDGGSAADTAALPGSGLTSSSGASPGPSEGSQREWRMPASFKRTALPPEPLTTFLGELLDEEELLEEQEQEPVRKKPRFTQSRYRLVSGDEEQWDKPHRPDRGTQYIGSFDPPDQITVPVDNPPTASTPTITVSSEPDTLQQRLEVPPPRLTVYDELHPEVPDSPDLKPVDSSGLPLISPLEHRGLSFSDYMGTRLEGPVGSHSFVGRGFGGSSSHVSLAESAGEQVFISSPPYELDITPSRSESSTGPNSLFDSLSPTPVQELLSEERGKSPVHPSPLRIVENFSSTLQQEPSPQQHSASRPAGKTPLLLPQVSPIQETPKSLAALEHVLQPEPLEGKRPGEPITPETSTKRGMARREGDPMFGIGSPLDAFFGKAEVPVGSLQEGDESSGEKIPEDTKIEVFVNQNTRNIKNQNILTSLSTTQSRPSSSTTTIRKFKSGVTTTVCS